MGTHREEAVEAIRKAGDIGRDLGAGIIGLGALTSVVTRGGRSVLGRGVAITSGNSFTTPMAMEAPAAGASKMKNQPGAGSRRCSGSHRFNRPGLRGDALRTDCQYHLCKAIWRMLKGQPESPQLTGSRPLELGPGSAVSKAAEV